MLILFFAQSYSCPRLKITKWLLEKKDYPFCWLCANGHFSNAVSALHFDTEQEANQFIEEGNLQSLVTATEHIFDDFELIYFDATRYEFLLIQNKNTYCPSLKGRNSYFL